MITLTSDNLALIKLRFSIKDPVRSTRDPGGQHRGRLPILRASHPPERQPEVTPVYTV
jgi:hypothetical protein